jgi:P pilus assembly chaperone PapD
VRTAFVGKARRAVPWAILLWIGKTADVTAQSVAIAPQMIVVDSRTNAGSLILVNEGNIASEVSISTEYGYPDTDSSGGMFLRTFNTAPDTAPSAASWIQVFPQRFRLEPHARRTVRLLVTPPKTLLQREYWGRIVVADHGAAPSNIAVGDTQAIHVGLNLEVRSVLAFFYRNGSLSTGLRIDSARAAAQGDSLVVRAMLTRTGTAAFVGSLKASLRDSAGKTVSEGVLPLGVYYTLSPKVPVPLHGVHSGVYTLVLTAVSSRPDVQPQTLVHAEPVQTTLSVTIP